MNANGSNQVDLTDTVVDTDATPDWSPDGTMIALLINATFSGDDIWVMKADGTNKKALTSDHNSYNPDWQVGTPGQGDVDCSITVNSVDSLKILRYVAGLSVAQNEPCADLGTGDPLWGDVDCSGAVNSVDSLKILRYVAALPVAQTEPCPDLGT
jgi:hypothetical protein